MYINLTHIYKSDNDNFVVRSFAALALNEDGNEVNETVNVKVTVCNETLLSNETLLAQYLAENNGDHYDCGDNDIGVEPPANPDYLVNSLVDIDGGTGSDRLTIVGTEFNDRYVVQVSVILRQSLAICLHSYLPVILIYYFSALNHRMARFLVVD